MKFWQGRSLPPLAGHICCAWAENESPASNAKIPYFIGPSMQKVPRRIVVAPCFRQAGCD
ncbi:MAG TPA: hypothetical protein VFF96_01900 [Pseudoxanthomonas sp.]|nr:hypothetical protein [Pseudoxanthomonas sp.]